MPRRLLLPARLSLIVLVSASVIGPALILASLQPKAPRVVAAAAAPRIKLTSRDGHPPWFDMNVIPGQPSFHTATATDAGAPPIIAGAGILVDADSGEIVWSRNPHKAMAPASTTKVLSSLVALENFSPSETVTVSPGALTQDWDESKMGLKAGERLTVRELLAGMLLVSGNDAATAMAVDTVGETRFVGAMNAQVHALGLHDSHFATPVGLSDPAQYASAYDLAAIAAVTYDRFSLFRQLVATVDTDLPASAAHQDYPLHNLNELLAKYPAAVGIKPGFTYDAGPCLVGMAVRGGHRLIAVLLSASYPAAEEAQLFDWAFAGEGLPRLLPPTPAPTPAPTPTPSPAPRGSGQPAPA